MRRDRTQAARGWSGGEADEEVTRLYAEHAGALARYARTITADESLAREAVQEAFLRYLLLRREGRLIWNPRAWLVRVLRNYLLDARRGWAQPEARGLDAAALASDPVQDPFESFRERELTAELGRRLTRREMDCLELRLSGMKQSEIASALGLKIGTVGVLLSRAGKKVRAAVQPGGDCAAA